MKTSDVLRKAGDISRERGWCRGVEGNWIGSEQLCAMGAVSVAVYGYAGRYVPSPELGLVTGDPKVWEWNDAIGRTHAEVLIALDAAYLIAIQEEGADLDEVLT